MWMIVCNEAFVNVYIQGMRICFIYMYINLMDLTPFFISLYNIPTKIYVFGYSGFMFYVLLCDIAMIVI